MPKNYKPLFAPEITFTSQREESKQVIALDKYPSATILTCLQRAINLEEYEEAALYRDELIKREVLAGKQ